MKVQGKLNLRIILRRVLMLLTENYQSWSMLVEATACQSWHVFFRHRAHFNLMVKLIGVTGQVCPCCHHVTVKILFLNCVSANLKVCTSRHFKLMKTSSLMQCTYRIYKCRNTCRSAPSGQHWNFLEFIHIDFNT